ncbi:methionine ABC transporter permease [Chromobacterium violaceum]|uniref:Methionine import system permease protein MetP n=2 Tax=Chromobacterium violaceum TaxID=536 RepID=A0AAX2M7K2_CHRVL|nr:methionine ABC transporter permease [Chromobacterium violaceum]AAQ59968.1 probable transmembrane ABC transporter protein [Chromobacterium violaceum ATCC 12472]ATP28780.1 ABC transporter permease [Chromobacterium violaceum]ATP32691.1 ABC transporter permease [Chromobacterium violaceum]KJH66384.1 methionine ABC transporter ATP-binding protein [Chromobacterium violaceum]KMN48654.1 methionine ABC transporter ATP-binding protein [Chromobacterium violaceum]
MDAATLNEALQNLQSMGPEIWQAILETGVMLGVGLGAAILFGGPLGVILYLSQPGQMFANRAVNGVLSWVVNLVRSFPFIILMVVLIPLTRALVGSTIGPVAASVPLSFAAIPYFARLVEQTLREIPRGVVEAAEAMGASPAQIIFKVLVNEARSGLISSLTILTISFLSYTAVAGVVGGGGIGDLAIRYGYYRFQTDVMVAMVLLLVVLVQIIQLLGNRLAAKLDKR